MSSRHISPRLQWWIKVYQYNKLEAKTLRVIYYISLAERERAQEEALENTEEEGRIHQTGGLRAVQNKLIALCMQNAIKQLENLRMHL